MAKRDWKRYYAPILAHKTSGECRLWAGRFFSHRQRAHEKGREINSAKTGNYRCIGIAAIRGKGHVTQQQLWDRSDGNKSNN